MSFLVNLRCLQVSALATLLIDTALRLLQHLCFVLCFAVLLLILNLSLIANNLYILSLVVGSLTRR